MSKAIAFIPIKSISKRIIKKNFRPFCGCPLYKYIIVNSINSEAFDEIYVDTDSKEIIEFAKNNGLEIIKRPEYMTLDDINGNDLLIYEYDLVQKGEYIFQLFATAPLLRAETIRSCVNYLKNNDKEIDSVFTASEETGWFWLDNLPVNYRPNILPRSQDSQHLIKESTGLYGITKKSFLKYKSRIGKNPKMYIIDHIESIDIDNEFDFEYAESIGYKTGINEIMNSIKTLK